IYPNQRKRSSRPRAALHPTANGHEPDGSSRSGWTCKASIGMTTKAALPPWVMICLLIGSTVTARGERSSHEWACALPPTKSRADEAQFGRGAEDVENA